MNVTWHIPHLYKVASHSVFQGVRGSPARGIFSVEQEGLGQSWASWSPHFRLSQGKGGLPSFCKWKPHSSERGAFLPWQKDRSESMCFDHSTWSAPERQFPPTTEGSRSSVGSTSWKDLRADWRSLSFWKQIKVRKSFQIKFVPKGKQACSIRNQASDGEQANTPRAQSGQGHCALRPLKSLDANGHLSPCWARSR